MNIDPAGAPAMHASSSHKRDHLWMGNGGGLRHLLVSGQEFPAASSVSDQEFAVDQIVTGHFIPIQQPGQFLRERRAIGKGPYPDGRVHQDHLSDVVSRRRLFTPSWHIL